MFFSAADRGEMASMVWNWPHQKANTATSFGPVFPNHSTITILFTTPFLIASMQAVNNLYQSSESIIV